MDQIGLPQNLSWKRGTSPGNHHVKNSFSPVAMTASGPLLAFLQARSLPTGFLSTMFAFDSYPSSKTPTSNSTWQSLQIYQVQNLTHLVRYFRNVGRVQRVSLHTMCQKAIPTRRDQRKTKKERSREENINSVLGSRNLELGYVSHNSATVCFTGKIHDGKTQPTRSRCPTNRMQGTIDCGGNHIEGEKQKAPSLDTTAGQKHCPCENYSQSIRTAAVLSTESSDIWTDAKFTQRMRNKTSHAPLCRMQSLARFALRNITLRTFTPRAQQCQGDRPTSQRAKCRSLW